jgi:alpha-L-fucosidase
MQTHFKNEREMIQMSEATQELSGIPQLQESSTQRDERMRWFRDAKFGMFIHWGPCSVGQKEIGWGREGNRPWDINRLGPRQEDPEYDNFYKKFNPTQYDADAWVKFAKESGMRYMVLITKHHDGFAMYDTKLSDYNIMNAPYGRDIVKLFVDACHRHGMKVGLYYSTRDWYHPDYLVGDNAKYDAFYRGQVEELLTHYGKIDMMWFDHVGGRDWGRWKFDELFAMMYRLQPHLLVNNRAAKFCGPRMPEDREPSSVDMLKMTEGDFYTPEGRIGSMDVEKDWESCIHVGKGWSYRGEDGFKGPEDCIRMLVSCTTGGGNLLLNFGPRPDGTFADGEAAVACAAGKWLGQYGEAIYGTRGGPYRNGPWGGSCHKENRLFLFIYEWPSAGPLSFDPLPRRVISARTLEGVPVTFDQDVHRLEVDVPLDLRVLPVTVIELTLDQVIEPGTTYGVARMLSANMTEYGHVISEHATLAMSSISYHDRPEDHPRLFRGERSDRGYAVHTECDEHPWVVADLGDVKTVKAVVIENRAGDHRSDRLVLSVSEDGKTWAEVWRAIVWDEKWLAVVTHFHAGIDVPGRRARYLKFELDGQPPRPLILQRITVFGEE